MKVYFIINQRVKEGEVAGINLSAYWNKKITVRVGKRTYALTQDDYFWRKRGTAEKYLKIKRRIENGKKFLQRVEKIKHLAEHKIDSLKELLRDTLETITYSDRDYIFKWARENLLENKKEVFGVFTDNIEGKTKVLVEKGKLVSTDPLVIQTNTLSNITVDRIYDTEAEAKAYAKRLELLILRREKRKARKRLEGLDKELEEIKREIRNAKRRLNRMLKKQGEKMTKLKNQKTIEKKISQIIDDAVECCDNESFISWLKDEMKRTIEDILREVIGKDDEIDRKAVFKCVARNELRAEQRQRAKKLGIKI